jgi:hypothetical protein
MNVKCSISFFTFFFWPTSRPGPDYEALGNWSLNFVTLG